MTRCGRYLLALAVPIGLAPFCHSASDAALIRLKPAATASAAVVRLADIADIQDPNPEMAARLGAVTLAPSPAPQRTIRLDFEAIRGRLAAQGLNVTELEFSGSSVVTVSGIERPVIKDPKAPPPVSDVVQRRLDQLIASAAADYLRQRAPQLGNVAVEVQLTPEQVSLLARWGYARYALSGGTDPWSGDQTFSVRFVDREQQPHEVHVRCQVTPQPRVPVLKHNVPQGHLIQADDLDWRQVQTVAGKEQAIGRMELLVGQEATSPLRGGEPVTAQDIRAVPLVRRGDIVTVLSRRPGITVRMEAKAQGDGSLGQPLLLISLDGRQKISARVSGYHEAVVTAGPPETGRGANVPAATRVVTANGETTDDEDQPDR